ncbi:hypothetical protein [Nocardioides nanhaiensis]|uniref:hypothetical protein n=1 Tax=Nocardioides nanhaiensis TaxID=1476871 RepID=UPI0031E85872
MLGALAVALCLLGGPAAATETPTGGSSETPTETPNEPLRVTDAALRWGVNNESSNRAFAPGTYNFFSAGTVPDPGRGGTRLARTAWRQRAGNVAVQKWDGTTWRPATWAGLSTTSQGQPLGAPTAGTFSNHAVVLSGGRGVVDRAAGTAQISWQGSFTVLYYSGMSFFTLSDPALTVRGGTGTLTATTAGYASSVEDPTAWAPVAPRRVTVATLPDVDLAVRGFRARPAYAGVAVRQQEGTGRSGAFPQSFVDYMDDLGTAAFWHASGASTDPFKVPLPLTVSYDAAQEVTPARPTPADPSGQPTAPDAAPPPPSATPAPTDPAGSGPPPPPPSAPGAPSSAPATQPTAVPGQGPPATTPPVALPGQPATQLRLSAARADAATATPPPTWPWLGGALLLLLAAALLLVPAGRPAAPAGTTPSRDHR